MSVVGRALDSVPLPGDVAAGGAAVSVWCGPVGGPARYARDADRPHYAASVMKMAILLAVDAAGPAADEHIEITDVFTGRDGSRVRAERDEDNDEQPWRRLGGRATLRWLAERAIVSSSNLASSLLIERLGLDAVRAQCPPGLRVDRQIGDAAARGRTRVATGSPRLPAAPRGHLGRPADGDRGGRQGRLDHQRAARLRPRHPRGRAALRAGRVYYRAA
jgi:beta-lactamase class A